MVFGPTQLMATACASFRRPRQHGVRIFAVRARIADELMYRERQPPFDPKGSGEWGAKPDRRKREFRN